MKALKFDFYNFVNERKNLINFESNLYFFGLKSTRKLLQQRMIRFIFEKMFKKT